MFQPKNGVPGIVLCAGLLPSLIRNTSLYRVSLTFFCPPVCKFGGNTMNGRQPAKMYPSGKRNRSFKQEPCLALALPSRCIKF